MPSIKDVAKAAGVSISTVSNSIRGTRFVNEELKKKVFEAIDKLGYEVNALASGLKSKNTNTVGIVIPNMNRIFFPQVIKGIQNYFSRFGYNLMLCDSDDDLKREKFFIQMLRNSWVDGVIVGSVAQEDDKEYIKFLSGLGTRTKGIPVVSLEREFPHSGISSVKVDNYQLARVATQHLLNCGCKKIVHISGPQYSCVAKARMNGYIDELKSANGNVSPLTLEGDFSPLSGYQAIKGVFQNKNTGVDGIFAANDQMAIGALSALREEGVNVPGKVKIVGFDNTFVASIVEPSITTINVPKFQMGLMVAELLQKRIENPETIPQNILLSANIIVRTSTQLGGDKSWELFGW
jgi:DNA-binding LacI/PurR family transcriptional regulator